MNLILAAFFVSNSGLVGLLINLLVLLLILGLIWWIITLLPLPPIFKTIAQIVMAIIVIIYLASFLTGCSGVGGDRPPLQAATVADPVTTTGQDVRSLAAVAADIYIERKAGNTDFVHSIAQGWRAYGASVTGYESAKKLIAQFSAGKASDVSFIDRLARLFASSTGTPAVKAEVIAQAIENKALEGK